jgi:8-oxo-dGTP pyrophosphatase MutT (NUDIX family)
MEKADKIGKLRDCSLVFLIKRLEEKEGGKEGKISEICLAMKKRGFGVGKWNGVGGKVEKGEKIIDAAKREAKEEINIDILNMKKMAENSFYFPHKPEWNQKVHVYLSEVWSGEPTESEEMRPQWFLVENIPYEKMWSDDEFWLPKVLGGKMIKASFVFGEDDVVKEKSVEVVDLL